MSRMRIVQLVCSDGFAGVERYIVNLSLGLAERGCDVTVVGGDRSSMESALVDSNVSFVPGDDMRTAARNLAGLGRIDLVNSHMTQADAVAAACLPRTRSKVVSTLHFAHPRGSGRVARWLARAVSSVFAEQIAISEFALVESGENARVILSGVPNRPASDPMLRRPVVMVAQRLEQEKATDLALRAWSLSGLRRAGWELWIAGSGACRSDLEMCADRLGITDSTRFLGHRRDIEDLFARTSILLATSPADSLGLSVVEAMSRGLPVVAAKGGGHLETVGNVTGAALFEAGSDRDAAQLMDRLGSDDERRVRYGEALRGFQQAHLGLERQLDQTLALYERVVR